jgi:methionyl-tRNA formyltransferase
MRLQPLRYPAVMPTPLNLIFCGTPRFAVPTLEKLVEGGHSVALVVTQPDRPRGRGMEVAVSPVKDAAIRLGIAVVQPAAIKNNLSFAIGLRRFTRTRSLSSAMAASSRNG